MAHAYLRNKTINVRYKRADGTWGSKSRNPDTGRRFKSQREAEQWGEEQEVRERLGLIPDASAEEEAADVTVDEWFATWWQSLDLGLRSRGTYEYLFRVHVLPEWGEWALKDITASAVNSWEQRMIKTGGYKRDGVPGSARTRLATLLGDAVTEGLIPSNPALRQRHRGRRTGVGTAGRGKEKEAATPLEAILLAERLAVMSGRGDDFILGVLFAWCGLRWGEAMGLQRKYVKLGAIRVDWQLLEANGRFYLAPPKDDSHRTIDLPPFLRELLSRQIAAHPDQRCACEPETIEGQEEQPCQGGGAFVFLGPKGGHQRNSNYARRFFDPAADGRYPNSKGSRVRDSKPVLVEVDSPWPGTPLQPWPAVVPGEPYERPAIRGVHGRPLGLGVNAASPRAALVAFAIERGAGVEAAHRMTREQILERFVRNRITDDTAVCSWLPIRYGLTPHELARHTHSTWLGDLGTPLRLRDDRMGHASPEMRGMRRAYTHVTDESRPRLMEALERLWWEALAKRAWFDVHSSVAIVDELLLPFRDGRRQPVPPYAGRGTVLEFPAQATG